MSDSRTETRNLDLKNITELDVNARDVAHYLLMPVRRKHLTTASSSGLPEESNQAAETETTKEVLSREELTRAMNYLFSENPLTAGRAVDMFLDWADQGKGVFDKDDPAALGVGEILRQIGPQDENVFQFLNYRATKNQFTLEVPQNIKADMETAGLQINFRMRQIEDELGKLPEQLLSEYMQAVNKAIDYLVDSAKPLQGYGNRQLSTADLAAIYTSFFENNDRFAELKPHDVKMPPDQQSPDDLRWEFFLNQVKNQVVRVLNKVDFFNKLSPEEAKNFEEYSPYLVRTSLFFLFTDAARKISAQK
jgi:hypothetical protein